MRNILTKATLVTLLIYACFTTNLFAQNGGGWDLPCDSLLQFECNGELIELSVCDLDWDVLADCLGDWDWDLDSIDFGDWDDDWDWDDDDWDWDLDSIDYGDWDYDDWDWDLDSIDFTDWGFSCDSLFEFECNGEIIELYDDWDWDLDSIDFDDWDYDDWGWDLDSIDFDDWFPLRLFIRV